jgi:sulfide:quinone oxidoreductase
MSTNVVIVGGGVAGLETLLALRALAGDRVDVTLVAPEPKFINQSMCVEQPFKPQRVRGIRLDRVAAEFSARRYQDTVESVDPKARRVSTRSGRRLHYDRLVLAPGAHLRGNSSDALTYRDGRDGSNYRLLLRHLRVGRVSSVAFVKPPGATSPLPLYDLALLTAADCAAHDRSVELSLVTPEEEPLAVFGRRVSGEIRRVLEASGVTLYTSSYAVASGAGRLLMKPSGGVISVDRIVTEPQLVGRRIPGIPIDHGTFIPTDAHGRVRGLEDVFAAGDATSLPVKHGSLAAQQADAVAEAIAASVGADVDPRPFRPVLRGVLLAGAGPRYLQADISGSAGDDSVFSEEPLWWPPVKVASRYLGRYLSNQSGSALDVHAPERGSPRPGSRFAPVAHERGSDSRADDRDDDPQRYPDADVDRVAEHELRADEDEDHREADVQVDEAVARAG